MSHDLYWRGRYYDERYLTVDDWADYAADRAATANEKLRRGVSKTLTEGINIILRFLNNHRIGIYT